MRGSYQTNSDKSLKPKLKSEMKHSSSSAVKLRETMMTGDGHDTMLSESNYEEIRSEWLVVGHNLTSVLMNPRESMFDNLFDEFATEQSENIDYSSSSVMSTISSLGQLDIFAIPQGNRPGAQPLRRGSETHNSSSMLPSTVPPTLLNEELISTSELQQLLSRMRRIFREYETQRKFQEEKVVTSTALGEGTFGRPSSGRFSTAGLRDDLLACFNAVPTVYFKQDFSLQESDIFKHAAPGNALLQPDNEGTSSRGVNQTNACQENLTALLDKVELALLKQIWTRSPEFFRTLDDITSLRERVAEACGTLTRMRERLRRMDTDVFLTALRIPQLKTRVNNQGTLQHLLNYMKHVQDNEAIVQSQLRIGDFVGALQLANETLERYAKELSGVTCMSKLISKLQAVGKEMGEKLVRKFVSLALAWQPDLVSGSSMLSVYDNKNPSTSTSSANGIQALSNASNPKKSPGGTQDHRESDPLDNVMNALFSAGLLERALNEYKNEICDNIRLVVKSCVSEYMTSFDPLTWSASLGDQLFEETPGGDDTPFAQRVRGMGSEDFLSALSVCVENLLLSLKRTASVHEVISYNPLFTAPPVSTSSLSSAANALSPAASYAFSISDGVSNLQLLSRACVEASCDLAQRSISQLLKIRRDSTARLSLDKMKFLSETCRHFLMSLDRLVQHTLQPTDGVGSGKGNSVSTIPMDAPRRGLPPSTSSMDARGSEGSLMSGTATAYELSKTLRLQSRTFLDHLQETYKQRLVSTLDADRWVQADVVPERQMAIDRLVSGRAFMGATVSTGKMGTSDVPSTGTDTNQAAAPSSGDRKRSANRAAMVDGTSYRVVWSCLLLCEMVMSYLNLSSSLVCVTAESLAKESIPKVVELLKLFDTRTKYLVLGAGAIQSAARLKSISAKHLAYTAQSLGLIKCLIPHIRAAILAMLHPKHHMLLSDLDRVSNDYFDHHALIVAKLVTIAGDAVEASSHRLRAVDWDRFQGQCEYFDEVVQNITALHRVLLDSLPADTLRDVFVRIFTLIGRKIPSHFETLNVMPTTHSGRQRILEEVHHTSMALGRLKGVDAAPMIQSLEEAFRKRYGMNGAGITPRAS